MSLPNRPGALPQLVQRLGGTLQPASGDSEVGRGRVCIGNSAVLLIAYDRSSDAWNRGYRGRRPEQTVSVRGVRPEQSRQLESLLLQRRDVQDLLARPRRERPARPARFGPSP
jgi:hypothetical protein